MSTNEQPPRTEKQGLRVSARQIAGIVVLVVFIVFLAENTRTVPVRLIGPVVNVSLVVALLIAGVLGALVLLLVQRRRRK